MEQVRFVIIDLNCNEPVAAFDSIDDANEFMASLEFSKEDINAMVDTLDNSEIFYGPL